MGSLFLTFALAPGSAIKALGELYRFPAPLQSVMEEGIGEHVLERLAPLLSILSVRQGRLSSSFEVLSATHTKIMLV